MYKEPEKPKTVPEEAIWNASENEWEIGEKNEEGKNIGEWKWWLAPNGHLVCHTFFDEEGKMLSFTRFHPNGEISREGKFENGEIVKDIYYRSFEPTTEIFVTGREGPEIWKAVRRKNEYNFPIEYDFYDKSGNHLNPPPERI